MTVHHPITREHGDLELALYGSFLPVPDFKIFAPAEASAEPGEMLVTKGEIQLNDGRTAVSVQVTNLGDRPVQVGSHYHFIETNAALRFDRAVAYGKRLDIPAGTAVRFEPGETKTVQLVEIAGAKRIAGGNNLASGTVSEAGLATVMKNIAEHGFSHT